MNSKTFHLAASLGVLAIAVLVSPRTSGAQNSSDSVAILRSLAKRWQEEAPGKQLGLMTAFAPAKGAPHDRKAPEAEQREKATLTAVGGSGYRLIDPVKADASDDARKTWFNVVKHLW